MRRGGFTMIELIFVIVILGILAAVALPKFVGVSEQAHEGNLKAFIGTLNRTVGPTLWSKHIAEGGSVTSETSIKQYIDIPHEISGGDLNLKNCGKNEFADIGDSNVTVVGIKYDIYCRDGNATHAPAFQLRRGSDIIAGPQS